MIKINKSNSLFQISSDRGVGAKRCEQMTAGGGGRVGGESEVFLLSPSL